MGKIWKMPSLYYFIESLIHEKNKFTHSGDLNPSKPCALLMKDDNKKDKKNTRNINHIDGEIT